MPAPHEVIVVAGSNVQLSITCWLARVGLALLFTYAVMAAAVPPRASAAFPGRNGAIAYSWPDPEGDLAYLAFLAPDGAVVPRWIAGWEDSDTVAAFSPDGRRAVAGAPARYSNGTAIAVIIAPSRRRHVLTSPRSDDSDGASSWSPDGRSIVFERFHGGGLIYTIRADGTHLRRLTRGESPVWSTLGRLAFVRDGGRRSGIYTSDLAGHHLRRLTFGRDDYAPDWSPDGRRLAFERDGDIYTVAAEGGDLRPVSGAMGRDPTYSPDGNKIAYVSGDGWLSIIPTEGGSPRLFRCEESGCFDPAWLPAPSTTGALPNTGTSAGAAALAGTVFLTIGLAAGLLSQHSHDGAE